MEFLVISCVLLTFTESINFSESTPLTSSTELSIIKIGSTTELTTSTHWSKSNTVMKTTEAPMGRCCVSTTPKQRKRNLMMMSMSMEKIPKGSSEIQILNMAYNNIDELPEFIFYNNSLTNLRKIFLQQNRIENISVNAFKGVRHVRQIDLSDNLITALDPYTFKSNNRLQKLILVNNLISFDRLQTFILSHSIEHLVLSNNKIDQIYELSFLGVPNIKSLVLDNNDVSGIAPNSFKTLSKLNYLSLANTGVYRLGESMFSHIPRILNLEGTPLSAKFEPPLTTVTGQSVVRLVTLSRVMVDEHYFTTK